MASTPVFAAALMFFLPPAICIAQPSQAENPSGVASAASQVVIPVVVRDKHGAPATGLTAADLTLTDSGQGQIIKELAGGPGGAMKVGLLVDTSRGMARAMDSERKAAAGFVDQILPASSPGSASPAQAFLIHFDREVELLEDFTANRDKLHGGLDQLGTTQQARSTEGPETTDSDSSQRNFRTGSPQLYDAIFLAASEVMKPASGRKALIVFSNGLDSGSKKSLSEAIEAAERTSTAVYTVYFKGDEQQSQELVPGGRRRGGMGGGWPGSGGGWPGGHGGNPGGGGSGASKANGKEIMQQIASRTGGLFFQARKTAELADIYSQIASDLRGQYLLICAPVQRREAADFHRIEVKAAKAELDVTAPEGYYSPSGESK